MSSSVLHQVESLLDKLTPSEQAILLENLARRVRLAVLHPFPPQDLYGVWKDKVPQDVDVRQVLREIRQEWTSEWNEEGTFTDSGLAPIVW
jgi:hypothetical protein